MKVAAVDVGTNSTRLLIADWDGESLRRILAVSRITRLGRGVDATGRLEERAMSDTLACLADYRDMVAAEDVERTIAVATSAVRDAANRDGFLARAAAADVPLTVLSGDDEARYAFAGATLGRGPGEQLVIDAGGGSTELVAGRGGTEPAIHGGGTLRAARSLDIGCVRLTERYIKSDPPLAEELEALAQEVRVAAAEAAAELAPLPSEAIAVGGTATTLAAIHLGLTSYDDAKVDCTTLDRQTMASLRDRLAAMRVAQIAAWPIIQPGRADVLVAGAALLMAVMEALGLEALVVRDRDILDGLALAAAGALG